MLKNLFDADKYLAGLFEDKLTEDALTLCQSYMDAMLEKNGLPVVNELKERSSGAESFMEDAMFDAHVTLLSN